MLTVCPKCALTLAVTAADLRLGQGYVRCGRCSDVFNALLTLREETVADAANTQPQPVLKLEAPPPEEYEMIIDVAPPAELQAAAMPEAAAGPELSPEPLPEPEHAAEPGVAAEPETAPEPATAPGPEAAPKVESAAEEPAPTEITPVHLRPPPPPVNRQRIRLQIAGIALASLLLAAQCIHHWRDTIASHPPWSAVLERVYAALGVPLTPDWKLDAYDLRQLGTTSYGDNQTLWIRLRLGNRGARAVPWPQLRVSLSDRYGKHLASRVLQPRDYLTRAHAGGHFMQPAQHIESEVGVVSPVAATSSFELDVCLPAPGGVRCANDEVLGPPARS
jgi:predicted Zn finger-like uncharacterized protein